MIPRASSGTRAVPQLRSLPALRPESACSEQTGQRLTLLFSWNIRKTEKKRVCNRLSHCDGEPPFVSIKISHSHAQTALGGSEASLAEGQGAAQPKPNLGCPPLHHAGGSAPRRGPSSADNTKPACAHATQTRAVSCDTR